MHDPVDVQRDHDHHGQHRSKRMYIFLWSVCWPMTEAFEASHAEKYV